MRDYEEYDLPDQRDVENAVSVILEKVEIAKRNKGKISTETEKAVAVLKQLLKANAHPYGGWAIFRPERGEK